MTLAITVLIIVAALFVLGWSRRLKERASADHYYPHPGEGTDADVERFVRNGRKLTAIKLYREIHDVGLKTAKEAVDRMAAELDSRR